MGKLATLAGLDPADRRAAFEALAELALAMAMVGRVAPRHWRRAFSTAGVPSQVADPAEIRRVRIAVARAEANLRWLAPKCLPLALAAQRMLARRGIAAQLHLGTALPGTPGDRFHAWLKVGDAWVTGDCDESAYAPLAAPLHTNA